MRNPNKTACAATSRNGQPCRNYALTGAAYCRSHSRDKPPPNPAGAPIGNENNRKHGAYSEFLTDGDLLAIASGSTATLDDEIAFTRAIVRRLAERLVGDDELGTEDTRNMADALFRGTGRIAMLLKTNRSLSGQTADGLAGAIATALDELSNEWGVTL